MNDIASLFNLPLETLLILGSGYLGYLIAFTGKNRHHGSIDVAFGALVFGIIAKISNISMEKCTLGPAMKSAVVVVIVLLCAAIWRKWIERLVSGILRRLRISISNGSSSAWDHIRHRADLGPTQIIVRKKSGSQLMCDQLWNFRHEPTGPCIYGNDGSIAIFVTAYRVSEDDDWSDLDPTNQAYGSAMTFIPADEISEIEVRHKK